MPGPGTTPLARRRLRLLAFLAGFVACIIVIAFIGAFRNQGPNAHLPTTVRIDARTLAEGAFTAAVVDTDVMLHGHHYGRVTLFVVRTSGHVHALWAHSARAGCDVVPFHGQSFVSRELRSRAMFVDSCGGDSWAIDGRCLDAACLRPLDEFAVFERGDVTYADLTQLTPHPF